MAGAYQFVRRRYDKAAFFAHFASERRQTDADRARRGHVGVTDLIQRRVRTEVLSAEHAGARGDSGRGSRHGSLVPLLQRLVQRPVAFYHVDIPVRHAEKLGRRGPCLIESEDHHVLLQRHLFFPVELLLARLVHEGQHRPDA